MQKRYLSVVFVAVFIVVLLAAGVYVARGRNGVESDAAAIHGPVKTYSSSTYGLIFLYPKAYFAVEHDATSTAGLVHSIVLYEDTLTARSIVNGSMPGAEAPPSITVAIYNNAAGYTTDRWVRTVSDSNFHLSTDKKLQAIKLGGEPALSYTWSGLYEGRTIARVRKTWIYALSVTHLSADDRILADFAVVASSTTFLK